MFRVLMDILMNIKDKIENRLNRNTTHFRFFKSKFQSSIKNDKHS